MRFKNGLMTRGEIFLSYIFSKKRFFTIQLALKKYLNGIVELNDLLISISQNQNTTKLIYH